jgi:hypothetical protein
VLSVLGPLWLLIWKLLWAFSSCPFMITHLKASSSTGVLFSLWPLLWKLLPSFSLHWFYCKFE